MIHIILLRGQNDGNTSGLRCNLSISQKENEGIKTETDLGEFSKVPKKIVVETALNAELTDN